MGWRQWDQFRECEDPRGGDASLCRSCSPLYNSIHCAPPAFSRRPAHSSLPRSRGRFVLGNTIFWLAHMPREHPNRGNIQKQGPPLSLASGGADASTSSFLCSLAVVVCPLLDLVQGTRKLGRSEAVAIALAVAGTGVLELTGSVPGTGDLWAMVQPLVFGTPFWKVEQLIHKFPTQANANRGKIQTARLCTSFPPKQMPVSPNGGPCIWMFPRFGKFPRFPRPQGRGILETQRHSRLQQSVSSLWPGHSTLAAVALAFRVLLLPPPQLVTCCRQTEDWCQR